MDRFNSTQKMSFTGPRFVVRSARSVKEASQLWWPLMKQLGWVKQHSLLLEVRYAHFSYRTATETTLKPTFKSLKTARTGSFSFHAPLLHQKDA
jgi:hypothetical protein